MHLSSPFHLRRLADSFLINTQHIRYFIDANVFEVTLAHGVDDTAYRLMTQLENQMIIGLLATWTIRPIIVLF